MNKFSKKEGGQALITLLVFTVMASAIITGAVAMIVINSQATGTLVNSEEALKIAEAGVDNAAMRLLRDPGYTGETLTVGNGTATIIVNGGLTKTVVSEGISGDFKRKVQATIAVSNNTVTVTTWSEID